MARRISHCHSCGRALGPRQKVCSACGVATETMSFAERSQYELQLWRMAHERERSWERLEAN
jgi:predicted nucleic acid-binding Zn ribbon protein